MIKFDLTLLFQFLNILILVILLNFLLFKPVLRALDKRKSVLDARARKAKEAGDNVKQLQRTYDEEAKAKRKPVLENKEVVLAQARDASMQIVDKARTELADELIRVREGVAEERRQAFETLHASVERLSQEVTNKVLGRGAV
jgi:F-type H+-transporting ATPase subunit b